MTMGIRILMGNDPLAYRQVQASALRALRPDAEIVVVAPDDVEQAVARLAPHLVIFSTPSAVVEQQSPAWMLLNPDTANLAVVSIAGSHRVIAQVTFEDLLAVIDETVARLFAGDSGASASGSGSQAPPN